MLRRMLPPNTNPSVRYPKKKDYLNILSATGATKPDPTELLHLVRMHFLMTGAHRINFILLLKQQV